MPPWAGVGPRTGSHTGGGKTADGRHGGLCLVGDRLDRQAETVWSRGAGLEFGVGEAGGGQTGRTDSMAWQQQMTPTLLYTLCIQMLRRDFGSCLGQFLAGAFWTGLSASCHSFGATFLAFTPASHAACIGICLAKRATLYFHGTYMPS